MKAPTALLVVATAAFFAVGLAADGENPAVKPPPSVAPPNTLPAGVVGAAAALFDQGMADPRGGEYREVEIDLQPSLKTHAWVLPAGEGQKRYAVGWNGLVYPVTSVGASADLAKDLAAGLARWRLDVVVEAVGERYALSTESVLRVKIALLLRLGEVRLAEKVWHEGKGDEEDRARVDPYTDMTAVWLGSWYNRAVRAYLRDDYPEAADICRRLSPVLAQAEATAHAHGVADPWPKRIGGLPLWQMPVLLAEAQRRMDQTSRVPVPDAVPPVTGSERIAALIRDLDQVRVRQWVHPGQTDVFDDPVVQALVKEGDAAVPALLRCLVEDQRLTRSRFTGGGWTMESGPIIPVYEAAYSALFRLLNVRFPIFERDSGKEGWSDGREPRALAPEDRRVLAGKLEAFWRKNRGVDPVERAYDTLRDDAAGEKAWLQAVDTIVQPDNGEFTVYLLVPPVAGSYEGYVGGKPFTPRGERLRSRASPSVAELMIRRFGQLSEGDDHPPLGLRNTDRPGKFLLALAAWDGRAHLDDLRRMQGELLARFARLAAEPPQRDVSRFNLLDQARVLVSIFERRQELGDPSALPACAEFLGTLTPQAVGTGFYTPGLFRLMWRHPDDPDLARAADWVLGEGSPWVPFARSERWNSPSLIRSWLVAVPAFQRAHERGLRDTSDAGEVVLGEDGHLNDGTSRLYALDPRAPPKGTRAAYRICDDYAHALSETDGFPRCELYWPQAERDRAVAACREFLRRYAGNLRYRDNEDKDRDEEPPFGPSIRFPVLDHPATQEDVRAGRAIFSLPTPSRVCRLPGLPLIAERPGGRADPTSGTAVAADGSSQPAVVYNNRGVVWQAEETFVNGRWERSFGFVERYQLEKVAAAEIEFPIGRGGTDLTPKISVGVGFASSRAAGRIFFGYPPHAILPMGERVSLQVQVDNHSGFDQTVPGAVVLPADADKGALPPGVRLSLQYSEKVPERTGRIGDPPFDFGRWRDVPPREGITTVSGPPSGPVLLPGEYGRVVMEIDLRDFFDVSRAGSYRLRTVFRVPGQPEAEIDGAVFSVARAER